MDPKIISLRIPLVRKRYWLTVEVALDASQQWRIATSAADMFGAPMMIAACADGAPAAFTKIDVVACDMK
jgi:hypothetical protein